MEDEVLDTSVQETSTQVQAEDTPADQDNGLDFTIDFTDTDTLGESQPQGDQNGENKTPMAAENKGELTTVYNGETVTIPPEQIESLVQKGLNYDHVVSERDTRYKRELDVLDRYAAISGVSREKLLGSLEQNIQANMLQTKAKELLERYPDMPIEAAEGLAQETITRESMENAAKQQVETENQQDAVLEPWRQFFTEYPSVKAEEIPSQVLELVASGQSPITAYQKHKIEQLEGQVKQLQTNVQNKQSAVGTIRGNHSETEIDPFLQGLNKRE